MYFYKVDHIEIIPIKWEKPMTKQMSELQTQNAVLFCFILGWFVTNGAIKPAKPRTK